MLKDLLARFRADPIIKQTLGRGDQPPMRAIYDRIQFWLSDPEMADFIERAQIMDRIVRLPFEEKEFTNYKPSGPIQSNYYREFVESVARELGRVSRNKLTADARKQIVNWCNANGHRHLSQYVIDELNLLEGIKPSEPVELYRGLLFQKWQMERPSFMGSQEEHPKSARIFVDALMHGHTQVMIDSTNPSSWTRSQDTADRFARNKAATSQHAAMMNWVHSAKKHIQGELGIIVSGFFIPRDIICDVNMVDMGNSRLNHGNESELIIRPGHYRLTIEHVFTQNGPISVQDFAAAMAAKKVA